MSCVTCHLACVTFHVSPVMCHLSPVKKKFKFVKLVGGESVINGATPRVVPHPVSIGLNAGRRKDLIQGMNKKINVKENKKGLI